MVSYPITSLHVYPVKSLGGIALERMPLYRRGPCFDREWMIVDRNNRFMTQRDHPRMALIGCSLTDYKVSERVETASNLRLQLPDGAVVDIDIDRDRARDAETIAVQVWNDTCMADIETAATGRLSEYMGEEVKLVRMRPDFDRIIDPDYTVDGTETVGFADAHPLLIISDSSLQDLNEKLEIPVPMNRFRPNITVGGGMPFMEDSWKIVRCGEVDLHVVKACARCVMTTVEQESGIKGKEPLRTLANYRKVDGQVLFGQDAIHKITGDIGEINVGDLIQVND